MAKITKPTSAATRGISALRQELGLPAGLVNLNAGTVSPPCPPAAAAAAAWRQQAAADPIRMIFRDGPRVMEAARQELAVAFRCPPQDLLLFGNASFALNTVLTSHSWRAGDEIVVSDQEYSHYWPLLRRIAAAHAMGIKIVQLPLAGAGAAATPASIVALIAAAITPRTRALFLSHVTSPTGLALPAAALCALARERRIISIIDGAHAAGLVDVDLAAIGADFYAANLHKWLMGATGAAFLYVAPAMRQSIAPLLTFSHFEYDPVAADTQPAPGWPTRWALSHEYQGTRDLAPFAAIPAALSYREELGPHRAAARWRELRAYAARRLAAVGYEAVSPAHPELATAMLAVALPGVDPSRFDVARPWQELRDRHGLEVLFPAAVAGAPALLRVSTAWFNTEAEIDQLVEVAAATDFRAYESGRTPT